MVHGAATVATVVWSVLWTAVYKQENQALGDGARESRMIGSDPIQKTELSETFERKTKKKMEGG